MHGGKQKEECSSFHTEKKTQPHGAPRAQPGAHSLQLTQEASAGELRGLELDSFQEKLEIAISFGYALKHHTILFLPNTEELKISVQGPDAYQLENLPASPFVVFTLELTNGQQVSIRTGTASADSAKYRSRKIPQMKPCLPWHCSLDGVALAAMDSISSRSR